MRNGSLLVQRRQLVAASIVAAGLAIAQTEAALAHHYTNPEPTAGTPCTSDWNTWGGDARSRTEPGVPGIGVRITGSSETGYRYSGATPLKESHVRIEGSTLVADVGAYPTLTSKEVNKVTVTGTGTPSDAKFCRFFDDPYREGAYPTAGSREHYSGAQQNHHYTQPGSYGPWMHAIDNAAPGAWSIRGTDDRGLLYVNGPPSALFDYSNPARVGSPVSFDATASHDWYEPGNRNQNGDLHENGPIAYAWDLDGDGQFNQAGDRTFGAADRSTATYTYSSRTARTVRLKVTDQLGTQRILAKPLKFDNLSPRASFSFSPGAPQAGQGVSFVSSSDDPDGTISAHDWDLNGDGKYDDASGRAVSFAFPVPGRYPVGLRVTDDGAREATVQQFVVVSQAAGAASTGAAGASATVTGTSGVGAAAATRRFVAARLRLRAQLTRRGARLRTLGVSTARGATVRVRCVGRDCRPRAQTLRSRGRLLPLKRFQRSYRAGTVLHVYVTQRGRIGRYVRIKIRRGKGPLRSDLCLMRAGSSRPSRCR